MEISISRERMFSALVSYIVSGSLEVDKKKWSVIRISPFNENPIPSGFRTTPMLRWHIRKFDRVSTNPYYRRVVPVHLEPQHILGPAEYFPLHTSRSHFFRDWLLSRWDWRLFESNNFPFLLTYKFDSLIAIAFDLFQLMSRYSTTSPRLAIQRTKSYTWDWWSHHFLCRFVTDAKSWCLELSVKRMLRVHKW